MPRKARELSPEGVYITELSGNKLFFNEDDKKMFTEIAEKAFSDGGKIYGIELTEKTIKMIVKESNKGISAAMKSLKISYARYFNKAHEINGALFTGRFKSTPLSNASEADKAAKGVSAYLSEAAETPAAKPAVKKVEKPAAKPEAEKAPIKPAAKPVATPAAKKVEKPAKPEVKPAAKPEVKPEVKKPVKRPANEPLPYWLL